MKLSILTLLTAITLGIATPAKAESPEVWGHGNNQANVSVSFGRRRRVNHHQRRVHHQNHHRQRRVHHNNHRGNRFGRKIQRVWRRKGFVNIYQPHHNHQQHRNHR